ncbi:hypothetical protein FSP39_001719 [Pinctada imbricata]|uniref:Uncharacterized protein n=1 Tax=Pinctada imbricata TaxID=66713 RepID=A0AA88XM59_PINIB|nr:hypothetical protein FSP39_001719 [Pinctada imbricata]
MPLILHCSKCEIQSAKAVTVKQISYIPIGSIPKSNHEIINATACVAGVQTICDQKIVVSIKNCGKYNVYFLKQPSACPVAYCFGKPPTGKTGKPKVSDSLVNKQTGRLRIQELQFKCNFEALTIEYFYQIHWFIDGQASFLAPPRLYNSLNESTYLGEHERDESRGYTRLGIDVSTFLIKGKHNKFFKDEAIIF